MDGVGFNWVAVKELKLSYYIGETLLVTIYTHSGNPVKGLGLCSGCLSVEAAYLGATEGLLTAAEASD